MAVATLLEHLPTANPHRDMGSTVDKQARFNIWFLILAFFAVVVFQDLWTRWQTTADRIDAAVRAILHRVFDRTLAILEANRAVLEECARALLEKETLEEEELRALAVGLRPAKPSPSHPADWLWSTP